ncbi:exported hypothetical protein [Nitrolancea hollandica Lb]|uniref:Uncharacterized protein n=1 Tax=Nitrolancea hollandica Lb TaxID=1129897 RepID=I4ELI7_9BACT|nr:exported hypothetical protein [Nitrolancea hollandica Lb]
MSSFVILLLSFVAFVVLVVVFYRLDRRTGILKNPRVKLIVRVFALLALILSLLVAFYQSRH